MFQKKHLCVAIACALSTSAFAQEELTNNQESQMLEEMVVLAKEQTTFANNVVTDNMIAQQTTMTSVLSVIDNIPGVLINEGDTFGSDDWSTTISIRGFQVSLDEQQIGMTVDGIPNGDSNYGGGSKANRFIDTENLQTVEVSQGTADIASRSHEALGGTLNFVTQNPLDEARMRFSVSQGDYQAKKFYVRYDTGTFLGNTKAYVSMSTGSNNAWIDQSGESNRNHYAIKVLNQGDVMSVTGYLSYDDIHEDNYQRVSLAEFDQNPDWDRLTGDWTGIPMVDQMYRRGWSTLRENTLGYVKLDWDLDSVKFNVAGYYHHNKGRGDWLPQYIADVTDDGAGNPESELSDPSVTVYGGSASGTFTYVDRDGVRLTPDSDCSSLTFPYGGTSNDSPGSLAVDPACFPRDAVPVGSYRHTHYGKDRYGLTADAAWKANLGFGENTLRGGMWYEDRTRVESRNWHKVIDSRTAYHYDDTPYWVQYDREYPQETLMYYIEDSLMMGMVTLSLGGKQWYVETKRQDNFGTGNTSVNSDSDVLPHAGILLQFTNNFEGFAGYAENYAAIKDVVLEAANLEEDPEALKGIKPETAENIDVGLRYNSDRFLATLTYYTINFENRITYIPEGSTAGIDYIGAIDGSYLNVGGIESKGIEASATVNLSDNFSVYASYTLNDSTYKDGFFDGADLIPEGKTVFGSAEDMFVLSLDWSKDIYAAGISNKYVGPRWMDPMNTDRIDAYNVADVYAAVKGEMPGDVLKGFEIRMTINNLLDEDYIGGVAGGWGGWIGSGRTAAVNLVVDF